MGTLEGGEGGGLVLSLFRDRALLVYFKDPPPSSSMTGWTEWFVILLQKPLIRKSAEQTKLLEMAKWWHPTLIQNEHEGNPGQTFPPPSLIATCLLNHPPTKCLFRLNNPLRRKVALSRHPLFFYQQSVWWRILQRFNSAGSSLLEFLFYDALNDFSWCEVWIISRPVYKHRVVLNNAKTKI